MEKENITFGNPQSKAELIIAYSFIKQIFDLKENHPRSEDYYLNVFETFPKLLIIAKAKDVIIGCAFSSKNQFNLEATTEICIGEVCVDPEFRGRQVGKTMLELLEKNAINLGFTDLLLGAKENKEGFYFKSGYIANLHFQMESTTCLEELKNFKAKYPLNDMEVKDGWSRVRFKTVKLDPDLEKRLKDQFPKCYLQYTMTKHIGK